MPTASHHVPPDDVTNAGATTDIYSSSRLLPSNRKLKHLHGLSVRHLRLFHHPVKLQNSKPDTATSAPIGQRLSIATPVRSDGQSKDTNTPNKPATIEPEYNQSEALERTRKAERETHKRPSLEKTSKRRSTLAWAGSSPQARQRKLEDITGSSMADTWFSLHYETDKEPFYLSEIVPKAMNPNYRFFDLKTAGSLVTRLDELTIKLWAKSRSMPDYELLIQKKLRLPLLRYLGKSLDSLTHYLSQNSMILHLSDGIYTDQTNILVDKKLTSPSSQFPYVPADEVKPTSSFDALMRLSTLDDCIQDALLTREKLASKINAILDENRSYRNATNLVLERKGSLTNIRHHLAAERKQLKSTRRTHANLIQSLKARREAISQGQQAHYRAQGYLAGASRKLEVCEDLLRKSLVDLRGQRRRICDGLAYIYPVEPVDRRPLIFQICGLPLHNSSFDKNDDDTTAAALGYVSHIVHLLSSYLSIPLPYPVNPHLSTSTVCDSISLMQGERAFPLYPKNSVQYRFEYGVFLLNKDIEFLMSHQGVKVLDLRHTLPNLKYLLYILSAGNESISTRRIDGIKGSPMNSATPTLSRTQSPDSMKSGDELKANRRVKQGEIRRDMNGGTDQEEEDSATDQIMPFTSQFTKTRNGPTAISRLSKLST